MAHVLVLQHNGFEGPERIEWALRAEGLECEFRDDPRSAEPLPDADSLAAVVIMGGAMGALDHDQFPRLAAEAQLVRDAVDAGVPVLGICLGHQIIATAFGAALHPGATREIGVAPVEFLEPDPWLGGVVGERDVLHWHGDNVDLPDGATLLASTESCPVQAFRIGSALGVQFHIELHAAALEDWLAEPEMLADLRGEDPDEILAAFHEAEPEIEEFAGPGFVRFAAAAAARARQLEQV